jgi:integrase
MSWSGKKLGLRRGRKERRLPQLLADADLKRFFRAIQDCGDVQHEILLKLLFYTAVRVSELVHIEVGDVDLECLQDFYRSRQRRQGPLHPVSGELPLGAQKPSARRAAQSISIRDSAVRAVHDTPNPANCARLSRDGRHYAALHPHLFRHQMLTYLTSKGLSDAQIQLISGHEAKRALRSTNTCHSNRSIRRTRMRSRAWGSKEISVGLCVPLLG